MTSPCRFCKILMGGPPRFKTSEKILRTGCYTTWIYACIAITGKNSLTPYKEALFSSFSKSLWVLADWLASYSCTDVWWNRPKRIGFPYSIFGENLRCCPCSPPSTPNRKGKQDWPIRMRNRYATYYARDSLISCCIEKNDAVFGEWNRYTFNRDWKRKITLNPKWMESSVTLSAGNKKDAS